MHEGPVLIENGYHNSTSPGTAVRLWHTLGVGHINPDRAKLQRSYRRIAHLLEVVWLLIFCIHTAVAQME